MLFDCFYFAPGGRLCPLGDAPRNDLAPWNSRAGSSGSDRRGRGKLATLWRVEGPSRRASQKHLATATLPIIWGSLSFQGCPSAASTPHSKGQWPSAFFCFLPTTLSKGPRGSLGLWGTLLSTSLHLVPSPHPPWGLTKLQRDSERVTGLPLLKPVCAFLSPVRSSKCET